MRRSGDLWRRHLARWLPPLVVCLVNVAILSTYGLVLASQASFREGRVERRRAELDLLEWSRSALAESVESARINQARIDEFYASGLSTESQRVTRIIAEVKTLARRAGLDPTVISYPDKSLREYNLVKRSIVFAVEGTYVDLRRFINFLELSEFFLTLEEIQLGSGGQGAELRINLKISTLFAEEDEITTPMAAAGEVGP
ncbi:MAG: hypothetical protein V3W50_00825 [Thermoanaerobaculia bacterium]